MTVDVPRRKRAAETRLDDMQEAQQRGDPQAADVPVPVDMEDLAAAPQNPVQGPHPEPPAGTAVMWSAEQGKYIKVLSLDVAALELVELGELTAEKAELLRQVRDQVSSHWASAGMDITGEEMESISVKALQLGAVDVAEVYSPHRFSARAAEFQLRPGFAADLEELKPNGEPWDLRNAKDIEELEKQQEEQYPILLTGSPPCGKFSALSIL